MPTLCAALSSALIPRTRRYPASTASETAAAARIILLARMGTDCSRQLEQAGDRDLSQRRGALRAYLVALSTALTVANSVSTLNGLPRSGVSFMSIKPFGTWPGSPVT
jgi:hypothetical protein